MKIKYHVPQNSIYITIDKIRYQNDKYMKCIVSYYYKTNGFNFCTEKNVKIRKDAMKHWKIWND